MFEKIKILINIIQFKLYEQHKKYIFDIYTNYEQILNIRSKYDANDILRETKMFLQRLSIEERINDLNYYCNYDSNDDIINDAPCFRNIRDIKTIRRVVRAKTSNWLEKLLNDILEYENELIVRLNIDDTDFQG